MVDASSVQVGLEWHGMKYQCEYLASTSGLWRAAVARLVFPIPPVPRIAMQAESCNRMFTTSCSSFSQPWKICGEGGSRLKDLELLKNFSKIDCGCRFGSPIIP
jgi:hypothetical protein